MDKKYGCKIISTGKAVPNNIVYNDEIVRNIDTTCDWIEKKIGVKQRHHVKAGEATSDLALIAINDCIEKIGFDKNKIEALFVATGSPDYANQSVASLIMKRMCIKNCAAHDIIAGCSGFVFAACIASSYIESGCYESVMVVSSEVISPALDKFDRGTYPYFGDGAAAVLLTKCNKGEEGFLDFYMGSDGRGNNVITCEVGGSRRPISYNAVLRRECYLQMNAPSVLRFAVSVFPAAIQELLKKASMKKDEIDFVIPHQANARIIEMGMKSLGLPMSKTEINIDRYGNTSCASIPILLDELLDSKKIKQGDLIVFVGFGAGLSYGAALYKVGGMI